MSTETAAFPLPEIDELSATYWQALRDGHLTFQQCDSCQGRWLPARSECPHCLSPSWRWERASGRAKLISWVVYHHAFHPAFKNRVPYSVAVVELAEGPRLISNVIGVADLESLQIDQTLQLVIEDEHGVAVPRFTPD